MSSRPDVLMLEPLPESIHDQLAKTFTLHAFAGLEALKPVAASIRGVTTGGGTGISADVLAALPNLEVISVNGVGTDRIDLAEARRRKIGIATTQGVLTGDVADMALALLLALLRQIVPNDRFVRSGQWKTTLPPLAHTLQSRKVGIAGFGHIGQAIARRVAAFDANIAYFNSRPRPDTDHRFVPDLQSLAEWADVLILAVSGGPRSANMVDATILRALGPQGLLINISRGTVVDEKALIAALQDGTIAGAGLDVFQNEPNIDPAFFGLPNTVLQPHQASATVETRNTMGQLVINNLIAHFEGRALLTPVI